MPASRRPSPSLVLFALLLFSLALALPSPGVAAGPAGAGAPETVPPVHIVYFPEAPLSIYRGDLPGLPATDPSVTGEVRLDPRSPASRAYLTWLDARQARHEAAIERALGRDVEVLLRYRAAGNGVAIRMSAAEADAVRALPFVEQVVRDYDLPLDTDRGPEMIGADDVWTPATIWGVLPTRGEGAVIGVIDTGVNMDHASFSDTPVDGHVFENPFGSGNHVGWCDPGNPNWQPHWVCNDKLIGAWDFADAVSIDDDGPEDSDGHGSHTASTAGGNGIDFNDDGVADMSGVAPHANLITYDACYLDPISGGGLCPFSATSAGVDQAILDGVVDSINYSISGGTSPWSGFDIDRFFLLAVNAGIHVSASAGNAGPGASTVNHLGPWVTTVAANTHDRVTWENGLVDMSGGVNPPADMVGNSRTGGYGPAPIVHAGDYDNGDVDPGQCLQAFPPGTWNGEIVVCDRGTIARVLKGQNVLDGGAGGFVLANVPASSGISADSHSLPATHVDVAEGDALRAWLASGSGHMATITGGEIVLDPAAGDIMASFSSRGPNPSFDVIKPDVSNPGVDVYAAVADGYFDDPGFPPFAGLEVFWLSGTSMSSPHTTGCAALLRSLYPDWSPAQVKSALMTSGTTSVLKENGVTPADPFDIGAGRVVMTAAPRVGLVLDESAMNFAASDPNAGGDPRTLNLASVNDSACAGTCSWTRTFESVAPADTTWTLSAQAPPGVTLTLNPNVLVLAPGETQDVEITADVSGAPIGQWAFFGVLLEPSSADVVPQHLTGAVMPAP